MDINLFYHIEIPEMLWEKLLYMIVKNVCNWEMGQKKKRIYVWEMGAHELVMEGEEKKHDVLKGWGRRSLNKKKGNKSVGDFGKIYT